MFILINYDFCLEKAAFDVLKMSNDWVYVLKHRRRNIEFQLACEPLPFVPKPQHQRLRGLYPLLRDLLWYLLIK